MGGTSRMPVTFPPPGALARASARPRASTRARASGPMSSPRRLTGRPLPTHRASMTTRRSRLDARAAMASSWSSAKTAGGYAPAGSSSAGSGWRSRGGTGAPGASAATRPWWATRRAPPSSGWASSNSPSTSRRSVGGRGTVEFAAQDLDGGAAGVQPAGLVQEPHVGPQRGHAMADQVAQVGHAGDGQLEQQFADVTALLVGGVWLGEVVDPALE